MRRGEVIWLDNDSPVEVLSFLRKCDEEMLSVSNLSNKEVKVSLEGVTGSYKPLMVEGVEGDVAEGLTLKPYGFYAGKKLK